MYPDLFFRAVLFLQGKKKKSALSLKVSSNLHHTVKICRYKSHLDDFYKPLKCSTAIGFNLGMFTCCNVINEPFPMHSRYLSNFLCMEVEQLSSFTQMRSYFSVCPVKRLQFQWASRLHFCVKWSCDLFPMSVAMQGQFVTSIILK